MIRSLFTILIATTVDVTFAKTKIYGTSIPPELAYSLPKGYKGDIDANFIDTKTNDTSINSLFAAARNATYYVYDDEFYSIVGSSPTIHTILASNSTFDYANEAGVWVPGLNHLYFTGSGGDPRPYYILDLNNNTIIRPNAHFKQPPHTLSGGDYFKGNVYFAGFGLKSTSDTPAIYSVNPLNGSVSTVLNTYFGVPFNPIDDLSWVAPNTYPGATSCTHAGEDNLFFTTLDVGAAGETSFSDAVLPNAIFRFTPSTKSVQAVISRADVLAPNGVRADPTGRYLYVSDVARLSLSGPGADSWGSPALYRYELDADCNPVNKLLFAMSRSGYADGIKVDRFGRVWTAEGNGIVVRDTRGRELGVFNGEQLISAEYAPISNFGLAGDKLVILSGDRILIMQLGQNVTTS